MKYPHFIKNLYFNVVRIICLFENHKNLSFSFLVILNKFYIVKLIPLNCYYLIFKLSYKTKLLFKVLLNLDKHFLNNNNFE